MFVPGMRVDMRVGVNHVAMTMAMGMHEVGSEQQLTIAEYVLS